MHQYLINAMNAIISGKLEEAKQWLNKLIADDHASVAPAEIAIAHYLFTYTYYLQNHQKLALNHYSNIDTQFISDKSLLHYLIKPQNAAEVAIKSSAPATPSTPAAMGSSPLPIKQVGFNVSESQPISSSYRCVEALQQSTDCNTQNKTPNVRIEEFKTYHKFWEFVLSNYLIKLGIPRNSDDRNQPTIDKIFSIAQDLQIPLFFLCQNLTTLSKFCCLNNNSNTALALPTTEAQINLLPLAPLSFIKEVPNKVITPTKSGLAAVAKQNIPSPLKPAAVVTSATKTSPSSSMANKSDAVGSSSKHKDEAPKLSTTPAKPVTPGKTQPSADRPLTNGIARTPPQQIITSPHVTIAQPLASDMCTTPLTFIPVLAISASHPGSQNVFSFEEDCEDEPSKETNEKQNKQTNISTIMPAATPMGSRGKNVYLLAQRKPGSQNDDAKPIASSNTSSTVSAPDKKINNFKLCIAKNNCLGAIMLLISGIRDSVDRFDFIPLVPHPSALEIATYCGHYHCLALIAKITNDSDVFDRALSLAVRNNQYRCIELLLNSNVSFTAKANMYFDIKNYRTPQNEKYLKILLESHINLYKALQYQHDGLVRELCCGCGRESSVEKENIITLAALFGYDCCLNESMLNGIDTTTINIAVQNAAKNNHFQCLAILLKYNINSDYKIKIFIALMIKLKELCVKDVPDNNWIRHILSEKSFKLFMSEMTNIEIRTAFLQLAKFGDPLYLQVLLKTDKIDKDTKTIAFTSASDRLDIDIVLALFNTDTDKEHEKTNIDVELENTVIKKLLDTNILKLKSLLIEFALNNCPTLRLLLNHGLPSKAADAAGTLHKITKFANLACLRLLLDHGFDINQIALCKFKDITVCTGTIAMIAAYYGHVECLQLLLEQGTDINDIKTANLWIQLPPNCHFQYQTLIVNAEAAITTDQNNNPRKTNEQLNTIFSGYTVFHFAATNPYCLQLLMSSKSFKKEMLDIMNTEDDTPLHIAVKKNRPKSVDLLLKNGANPTIRNKQGDTPLTTALRLGNKEAYDALMNNKKYFEGTPLPQLNEIFNQTLSNIIAYNQKNTKDTENTEDPLKTKHQQNIDQMKLIIDCLFSAKINWKNSHELLDIFQDFLQMIVRKNSIECFYIIRPFINRYFKLDHDVRDISVEFLGESLYILQLQDQYLSIIKLALNKSSWMIAKLLLEHIVSAKELASVSHLNDQQTVIELLKIKDLLEILPKETTVVTLVTK